MRDRWLLLDIGNTHTVAGVCDPSGRSAALLATCRFRTDPRTTADEYRLLLSQLLADEWHRLERAVFSSVVPALDETVRRALAPLPALRVSLDARREFEVDLPRPETMGADRLTNVAGALTLLKPPFLIVDAGTATKFCLVDARPAHIGGAIAPGLMTSWEGLAARGAKLPAIPLQRPAQAIGRTTEAQLQSGLFQAYEALIEGMASRVLAEAGPAFEGAPILATGGCLNGLALGPRFRVEPNLTLLGLIRYGQLTQ